MGTALLQVSDLVKSFRSPDGDSMTIVDTTRFALNADEQVAVRGASGSVNRLEVRRGPTPAANLRRATLGVFLGSQLTARSQSA